MAKVTKVRFEPGTHLPAKAESDIDAGTLVVVSAGGINPTVKTAGAGTIPLGVVAHSAKAGDLVTVLRGSVVTEVVAAGAIAVGDAVAVGANGAAVKAAEGAVVIGVAVEPAAKNAVFVAFK